MVDVLSSLEPRHEKKDSKLFIQNETVSEVMFIEKGSVDVGFEFAGKNHYLIRYQDASVFGVYSCTFELPCKYIFVCSSECFGFSIRKFAWKEIMANYPELTG